MFTIVAVLVAGSRSNVSGADSFDPELIRFAASCLLDLCPTPSTALPVALCNACFESTFESDTEYDDAIVLIVVLRVLGRSRSDDDSFEPKRVRFAALFLHDPCSFGDDGGGCPSELEPFRVAVPWQIEVGFVCGGPGAVRITPNPGLFRLNLSTPCSLSFLCVFGAVLPFNSDVNGSGDDVGFIGLKLLDFVAPFPLDLDIIDSDDEVILDGPGPL